ncbi:hypothetical protein GCM10025298_20560 [Natronobiforma cellulositropha]
MVYPALLPYVRETYGLTLTTSGLLLTVLWTAYALGQLPGGILADRLGEGRIMVLSSVIAALTLAVVVLAGSPTVLFAATALFGFGTALYGIARFTALADIYPEQVGAATGVTMAAGDAGNSLLPPLAVLFAVSLGWQFGFGVTIPLFVLIAVGLWVVVPARTSDPNRAVETVSLESGRLVLTEVRRSPIVLATTILVIGSCIWQAVTGFYPTYLIEMKGVSPTVAAGLFGLFFAVGIAIKPLAGGTYDRVGARRSLVTIIAVIAVALALVPFVQGFWPLVGATVLLSSLLGYATIALSYLTATLSEEVRGTSLGTLRTVYTLIAATSPAAFGAVADAGFFDEGFFVLAAMAGVMVLVALRLPERSGA